MKSDKTPQARLTYIGHSTVLIEMDGVRLITDPLFRNRVMHLVRLVNSPKVTDWQIDAILISHMHWDHLDIPSLRRLGKHTRLIVPKGAAGYLRRRGFHNIDEIERDEVIQLGDVQVTATYANHTGHRTPFGPKVDSVGFLIDGSYEVYFAGDTDLFPEMASLGIDIDVALLPVWGYGPTLGPGHLDPYRAAQSLKHLTPDVAVPIHWGTYCPLGMAWMQLPFLQRPPRSFLRHAVSAAPEVQVKVLDPGHSLELPLVQSEKEGSGVKTGGEAV